MSPDESLPPIHVLLVDDHPAFLETATELLEEANERLEIIQARSTEEGFDRLVEHDIDCVVADYAMDEENGIEFLESVRDRYGDLPFIVYTGRGSEAVAADAISLGVTDYMRKRSVPEHYELLANRIVNAVAQYRSQQEAAETEHRLETLAENTNDILWNFSPEWDELLFVNPAYEDIWGRPIAELRESPQSFVEGVHPDDRKTVKQAMDRLSAGDSIEIEVRVNPREDFNRWVWVQGEPVFDESGTVASVAGFARDISELKQRQAELEEKTRRNERFQTLIDHTSDVIFVVDEAGEISYINSAVEDLLGYSPEELIGESGFDIIHSEDLEAARRELERTVEDADHIGTVEFRAEHADGSTVDIEVRASNQLDNPNIGGMVVVARDITDRKEREAALEQYETLVEVAGDPMYMLDSEGYIEYVNEKFLDLSGYAEDALLGEHIGKVMDQDDLAGAEELIRTLLSSGERRGTFEIEAVTADGERIPAESHITLLFDDGEFNGSVGVMRVITERLERQRRLKRERDRFEEFAQVLSHDLRNPLNVATGRLELVKEDYSSEHVEAVDQAHERIRVLIDDMLSLANAGRTVGETEPVEIATLVRSCWQAVETTSAELVLETDLTIEADKSRLQQLMENLVRNAVDHGGPNVTVTVSDLADGFYVEDDGPGIPSEERDAVFDPGYSSTDDGTGFGLNIVREIAEAHGWDLTVTEGSDGGARFEFSGVELY